MIEFFKKNKKPLIGGLVATLFTALGVFLLGDISGYEAKDLLKTSMSGLSMLCNTIILASATILALLLTLLSLSSATQDDIKNKHYHNVLNIAKFDVILFISTLILFQLFNIPILESNEVPTNWYDTIYWLTLFVTSILSGMMIVVILMLYNAVTILISIVGLNQDHSFLNTEEEDEDEIEDEDKD